jgi:hypothetical protein
MRILIDTNIIIHREDNREVPSSLQTLTRILNELSVHVLTHPFSIKEIEKNKDQNRRSIALSKIKTYQTLDNPPDYSDDMNFCSSVGAPKNTNDIVDNALLYCVFKDAVDFLLTEDRGIHKKAIDVGLTDRVFDIDEALEYFKKLKPDEKITLPPEIEYLPVSSISMEDPLFESLVQDYRTFVDWWKKIARKGRKAWVFRRNGGIGAILILKIEDEQIDSAPLIPQKRRLKICTLKVTSTGNKIGELFIKIAIDFSRQNNIDELYLTTFVKDDNLLIELIENYGFYRVAKKMSTEEEIYIKKLIPDKAILNNPVISITATLKKYYPSFFDGPDVKKFVIPIRPEYCNKIFVGTAAEQLPLRGIDRDTITERNTIKKAYLSRSTIKKMSPGDILLFYRSHDISSIIALGVIERVFPRLNDPDEIMRHVGKRTVYSIDEIRRMVSSPVTVIIFNHHFLLTRISYKTLHKSNILSGPPQTITEISHDKYLIVKDIGGIDERFTIH